MSRLLWRQLRYLIRSGVSSLGMWILLFIILIISNFIPYDSFCSLSKDEPTILVGLIGAFVVLLTLQRNSAVQRAEFISGYLSQFYTNSNLWKTYHELIYGYWDKYFNRTDTDTKIEEMKDETSERIKNPESYEGEFPPRDSRISLADDGRPETCPTYHPWLFQGSEEEGRINALLGFLNGVDYYCAKGLIGVGEVYRHIGPHLLILHSRKVMESYFEINDMEWKNRVRRGNKGVELATKRARNLLSCIEAYDNLLRLKKSRTP